jgi:hypothetical protein
MGALGAVAASAIGRASPVRADDGDPVIIGAGNIATVGTTSIDNSSGNTTFAAYGSSGTGVYGYSASGTGVIGYSPSKGVWGQTTSGHAIQGTATSGFAGYFAGKVYTSKFVEMTEISAPAAPGTNKARLFARVNSSGKTQLCVRFQSGSVQVIKTEP